MTLVRLEYFYQLIPITETWNKYVTLLYIFYMYGNFYIYYDMIFESTEIENASLPYKTAVSEANGKTNKMVSAKWIYHKERSFASNNFIFFNFFFQFKNLL